MVFVTDSQYPAGDFSVSSVFCSMLCELNIWQLA